MDKARIEKELATNMSELFLQEPGVDVTGDVGGAQNINIRGMSGDRVLMIKDGMRMNEGYGANGLNDIIGRGFLETDNLDRVEIAKGPYSSLYGSDALGGIVLFKTKNAATYLGEKDWYGAIRAGFSGRSDEYKVGGTAALRFGKFETLINYTHRDGGQYKRGSRDAGEANTKSDSVLAKTRFNISDNDRLDFSVEYYKQSFAIPDNGGPHGFWLNLPGFQIVTQTAEDEKESTSIRLNYTSENENSLYDYADIAGYYQETSQTDVNFLKLDINSFFTSYVGPREMYDNDLYKQKTYGFTSSFTKAFGGENIEQTLGYGLDVDSTNTFRSNTDFRTEANRPTEQQVIKDETTYPFPENDTMRIGVYVFDEFKLMDGNLRITPGARWDYYKLTPDDGPTASIDFQKISEDHISPNLGVVYDVIENFNLFGQFSEGFKVPPYDLAYIFLDQAIFGYKIIPAEIDINPETSRAFEAGMRGQLGAFSGSFSAYKTNFDDFISVEQVGTEPNPFFSFPTQIFQYKNIEAVTIKGVEGKIHFAADNGISAFANAAWQTGKDDNTGDFITTIAPFNGTFGVSYGQDNYGVNVVVRWASEMGKVNIGEQKTPSWAVLDLTANLRLMDRVRLNVGIHNVLDEEYTVYSSVAGLSAGQDLSRSARAGRTFSITAEVEF